MLTTPDELFILHERNFVFEFLGECAISLQEKNLAGVQRMNFKLSLKRNGTIIGKLDLILVQGHSFEEIRSYFNDSFNLIGLDQKTGLPIIMERCFVRSWEKQSNDTELSCIYSTLNVILGKDNLTDRISAMVKFHFGLTNVFGIKKIYSPVEKIKFRIKDREIGEWDFIDVNRVILTTTLGKLEFYNYAGIDEDEKVMNNFKIPLITAGVSIEYLKENHNLDLAKRESIELVEEFLMLSSFIQSCKHDWKFVLVEKDDNPIFILIRLTKSSIPFYLPLNDNLDNSTYNGLLTTLHLNKYKPNIALAVDWYLESIANEEFDSKFLLMVTALECILNGYHEENQSGFIFTEEEFVPLKSKALPRIFDTLDELGIKQKEKIERIKNGFEGLRRRTLTDKFRLMLKELQIDYSDIRLKPNKIAQIRNDLVHKGSLSYVDDEIKLNEVYQEYKALWSVMIRIIFKLMGYSGSYLDPALKSLISI
jgi:hypothetical protein